MIDKYWDDGQPATVANYMLEQGELRRSVDPTQAYRELCAVKEPMPKGWRRRAALKLARRADLCWRRSGCQGSAPLMYPEAYADQVVWGEKRGRRMKVPKWALELDRRDD